MHFSQGVKQFSSKTQFPTSNKTYDSTLQSLTPDSVCWYSRPRTLFLYAKRIWKVVDELQNAAGKLLVALVQPPLFQTRIENDLQLDKCMLETDFFGFCKFWPPNLKRVSATIHALSSRVITRAEKGKLLKCKGKTTSRTIRLPVALVI